MVNPRYKSFLIIGCGHFGSRAAERLFNQHPGSKITVVDKNKEKTRKVSHLPVETIVCDGRSYLDPFLLGSEKRDYIVPAVPFHLVFEYLFSKLEDLGAKRGKVPALPGLPNPILSKTGDLHTSLADFLCPEDCPEPPQYCTVTKEIRRKPLYMILADLKGSFQSMVVRSEQLGLGVGGFQAKLLLDIIEDIRQTKSSRHLFLISTACRCHGVISALSFP